MFAGKKYKTKMSKMNAEKSQEKEQTKMKN